MSTTSCYIVCEILMLLVLFLNVTPYKRRAIQVYYEVIGCLPKPVVYSDLSYVISVEIRKSNLYKQNCLYITSHI